MKVETIEDSYQLSPMQQGMLFHSLYEQQSGVDIEQMICTLHENLNISAFKRAWQRVVERHPVLRTSFRWEGNNSPLQYVHQHVTLPLEQQDWSSLSALEQSDQLQAYLQVDRRHGFELTEAPLMRLALLRLSESDYQFIWTFHHIILDGRSFPIVLKEVFAFYDAFCQGQNLQLEQPLSYRDYIQWLHDRDLSASEGFFRQLLKGFTAPTPLIVDQALRVGLDQEESGFAEQEIRLSVAITSGLQSLAQQHQLTLNTLVQGAWALLLWRYSGEDDVVFGATRACRRSSFAGAESMVGLFINTLPVRVSVSPQMQLLPWLKELRAAWIALRDYEHTPLVKIQEWSEIPSPQPLFDSILVFENYLLNSTLRSQGGRWENLEVRLVEQTNYPLTLVGYVEPELLLKIKYDLRRFDDATIARMLGHIKTLLESMAVNSWQCLAQLPLLTARERYQMLVEWNDTRAEYPQAQCIHQLFEQQVERTPDAVAVVFEDQQLTYRELNCRANQLAHHLQALGVGPEFLVGICVERSLEMVVGLLGILKAGGAYVPLDAAYPKDHLAYMLSDSQVPVLLTQKRLLKDLPENGAHVVCLDTGWEAIAFENEENPLSGAKAENLAYVIYTSGSTGKPKGVLVAHQGLCNLASAQIRTFDVHIKSRVLQFASLSFDASISEIVMALGSGARLYLGTKDSLLPSPDLMHLLREQAITHVTLPPSALAAMPTEELPVRTIIVAGEACSPDLVAQWSKGRRFFNAYGPTESTVCATVAECTQGGGQLPIGRPIANTQIYILDRHLQPVPIGVPGELHIGGVGLARGYLNRPELTEEKFIPNPFSDEPGARLYKTGDNARYLSNGDIEYLGRLDNQVKIRGFRIELGEIEAVLAQHPTVQQTVVTARVDIPGNKRLVAYVVPNQDRAPTLYELRRFLKQNLPDYMIPSAFVLLSTLPLTPNGKVDRRALSAPDQSRPYQSVTFMAPRTPIEQQIANIWSQVLRLEQVGIHDNFFELGGHSLNATQVISQLRQALQVELPLRSLFEAPTVADLGDRIETLRWAAQELQAPGRDTMGDYEEGEL